MPKSVRVLDREVFYYVTKQTAEHLVENGEAKQVKPNVIRLVTPVFDRARRLESGRLVPKATTGGSGARPAMRQWWCKTCGRPLRACERDKKRKHEPQPYYRLIQRHGA